MISKTVAVSAVFAAYVFAMFAIATIPDDIVQTAETVATTSIE